jgi:phosphatidate cytidylyltransferase
VESRELNCFLSGIVLFVLTLKKNFYKYQFQQLAWTGMALLLVVFPTTFIISNMYQGIIWFILPALLVVSNDCWAFFFGKLFGRTPLIQLSPKKTWEGFIGATLATFVTGFFVSLLGNVLSDDLLILSVSSSLVPLSIPDLSKECKDFPSSSVV